MSRSIVNSRYWLLIAWIALSGAQTLPTVGQETSPIEWVSESTLPSGAGLEMNLARGQRIATHPSVIFADDFEVGSLGAKWDETGNRGNSLKLIEQQVSPPSQQNLLGKRSLQVTATLGKNTGGGLTKWFSSADSLFIRFYTKFDEDCDYVHHFCTLRANKSLRGGDRWSGFGGAGKLPQGRERFSTAIEPWGNWGKWSPPGRWNFYSYWHTMKASPDGKYWGKRVSTRRTAGH